MRDKFVTSARSTGWYYPESLHKIPVIPVPADELEFDADLLFEAVSAGLAEVEAEAIEYSI